MEGNSLESQGPSRSNQVLKDCFNVQQKIKIQDQASIKAFLSLLMRMFKPFDFKAIFYYCH